MLGCADLSLDAFLELKLENEKLREELRELQIDFDDDDYRASRLLPLIGRRLTCCWISSGGSTLIPTSD